MQNDTTIRGLIRACADDERTLKHEAKRVDAGRAEALTKLAREREGFVTDLARLADRAPQGSNCSWAELVREAARNVWVLAVGRNVGDAIAMCRHSRGRTEARYDDALQLAWPAETRRVLAEQRRLLHEETQELNQLQF